MFDYIFVYKKMTMGGCQLLIQKMASELNSRRKKVLVLCSSINEALKKEILDCGISISFIEEGKWEFDDSFLKKTLNNNAYQNTRIITFIWFDYMRYYSVWKYRYNVLLYAVHSEALNHATIRKYSIFERFSKQFIRPIITELIDNHQIVMMDEQTIEHTEKYYNIIASKAFIIRIPINIRETDFDIHQAVKKFDKKERIILAVARADFPFKGYLLGLIDLFKRNLLNSNFRLIIVSCGRGIQELEEAIQNCEGDIRDRITLVGETRYEDLREYFYQAHIFVGMGTGILDASKYGVISIQTKAYVNSVIAKHFFFEDYKRLGVDDGSEKRFLDLVNQVSCSSKDQIKEMVIRSYDGVQHYSTKNSVDLLESLNGIIHKSNNRIRVIYYFRRFCKLFIGLVCKNRKCFSSLRNNDT